MDIARLKQLRPYYANLDDDQIVDLVQKHDYPDRSRDDIAKALGVKLPAPAQPALPERSLFGAINDSVINAANSAAGVVKSGVDLFAPDSLLSQGIADFITMGQEKQSDKQKALNRQLSTDLQNAEGPLDKAGAYVKHALTADPLKTASDAAGNVLPFLGAGRVLAATRAPGAVATAANMGLAGIVGAGEVRGNIWDKISRTPDADLLEQSPEYAELRIQRGMTEAQAKQELGANLSRNLPEVGAVGALGALSGKFGLEGMAAGVAPKMGRVGSAAVGLADEALQGGAEQVATNKGVQRALPDQSLLDDVPLNMAMEGLGGMLGGAALGGRERVPDAGPLSRAANTALDQREKEQAAQSPLLALPAPTIRVTEGGQAITTDPRMGGILDVTPVASARESEDAAILAAARAAQQSPEQAMAQSQANIAMMAGRQQPTSLEMAQARVAGLAEQAGIEASVIPHPGGRGFMVIPSAWVAEPMRQQVAQGQQAGMLPSPDMAVPDGPLVADPQGIRPQTYADQQAARQAVRDVMDERDRMAQMGLTPDVERAQRTRALAQIQPGDITTPKGGAFKAEGAAKLAARKKGVTGELVQVRGGWVFRPAAQTIEDTTNGATGNTAGVAERPGADAGPAIGAGVADVGPDADGAVRRVDTAADRLVADSAGDLSGRNAGGLDEGGVIEQDAPQAAAGDTATQAEPQGDDARGPGQDAAGAPAAGVPGTGRAADVQTAGLKPKAMPTFLKTKTVPQMTAEELREAQAYYGPNHKRAKAIEKALAKISPRKAESGEGEKLPPTDIRDGDKVLVDGEVYTVTGSLKEGRKNVGVVADRDSDTDPLNGVKRVMLRGDDAIRAKIAADNLPAVKPSLSVEFGGKTYPVESVEDAQQKWVKFQETTGAGVSQVGNGVEVKDQTGKAVGRISYNGRAWDADGNLVAEAPAQEAPKKDDAPKYDPAKDPLADKRAPAVLAREKDAAPALEGPDEEASTQQPNQQEPGDKSEAADPGVVTPRAEPEKEPPSDEQNGGSEATQVAKAEQESNATDEIKKAGGFVIPERTLFEDGDGGQSPWLMKDGTVVGTGQDHISFADAMLPGGAVAYDEFMRATGAIRAAFFKDSDAGYVAMLHTHVGQRLSAAQLAFLGRLNDARNGELTIMQGEADGLVNPEYKPVSLDELKDAAKGENATEPEQPAAAQPEETPQITEAEARKSDDGDKPAIQEDYKPEGRTYLVVPFKDKELVKRRGAKWDAENKLWYADPIPDGMAKGEININLVSFIPEDRTGDDRYNYYGDKSVAQAVALTASARDGVEYEVKKRKHPDGMMMWSVVRAEDQAKVDPAATDEQSQPQETPQVTEAEARKRLEWRDLGQSEGTKTWGLYFKDAGGGTLRYGTVSKYAGSRWEVDGHDGGKYEGLQPAKKKAEDIAVERLRRDGYVAPAESVATSEAKTEAPARKKATKPEEKITDFGEKLEGARKDYASTLKDAMEVDVKTAPLSKSWPEPDYQKLLDGGSDPFMVSFIHAARDEIPTKPAKAWKLKGWAAQVEMLRDMAQKILSGEVSPQRLREMLAEPKFERLRSRVGGRAELYEAVGHGKSLKGVDFEKHDYALYRGEQNVTKWVISQEAKATAFSNWPREIVAADTKNDALAQFKAKYDDLDLGPKAKGQPQFDIYRRRGTEGAIIGKKIGREYIDLKKFADVKEARAYLQDNLAELEKALEQYKATPLERRPDNQPRVGEDHRNGAPVTPEVFAETFGFRGVQFGNYVEQARRQSDLNEAYDALMDLSAVLGVPPRALSLNGSLGLAFGARGKGGKGAPIAHFEQDKVVINLTKAGGPGSLAHEWWHSVDNYFARQSVEKSTDFVTGGAVTDRMRQKLREAFAAVKAATQAPTLRRRAALLDKRKSKPYWNTPIELSARAFESYVIAKLQDQGAANDYLANIVDPEVWGVSESMRADALGQDESDTYPYPLPAELPPVRTAFDDFFKTVETRTDDAGNVAMFSRRSATGSALPDAIIGRPLGDLNSHPEYAAAKAGDPAAALAVAEDLVTEDMVSKVKALGDGVVVVPVVSVEAAGRNKIPLAVAEVLADRAGLKTDAAIVQTNSPKRTGMDGLDRLLSPPEFEGPVVAGKTYVLVDDTITQGGTFAALASHIADNGGIVSGVISLTGKQYSARIAPSQDLLEQVRAKFGDIESDFRAATGYGFDALTESEARYLARHDSPQRIRNRIAEAGSAASQRLDEGRTGEAQGLTGDPRPSGAEFKRTNEAANAPGQVLTDVSARADEARVEMIENIVMSLVRRWKNAPEVVVLAGMHQAPARVREENERQIAGGAQGVPAAFFYGGKAYIMASEMKTIADVRKAVFHEVLGHLGLRGLYGKQLDKILAQVWNVRRKEVVEKGLSYGLDMNGRRDQLLAAEEVLAEMAQTNPSLGFVRRAIAAVRSWLRVNVPALSRMKMTDDEIINEFILPAQRFIKEGLNGPRGGMAPAFRRDDVNGFSRDDNAGMTKAYAYNELRAALQAWEGARVSEAAPELLRAKWKRELKRALESKAISTEEMHKLAYNANAAAQPYMGKIGDLTVDSQGSPVTAKLDEIAARLAQSGKKHGPLVLPYGSGYAVVVDGFVLERHESIEDAEDSAKYTDADFWRGEFFDADGNPQYPRWGGPNTSDVAFSRTAAAEQYSGRARELAQDFLGSAGTKVDWLDRTFKTQYAKAQKFPEFGKVFNRLQQYIESVSSLANQAADRAPSILPKLESVSDLWKNGIWRHGLKDEDKQAIAAPIFEGTLEWARKDGKLVRVAELEKEAEGLTTAQKESRLLRDRKVRPEQVKAWKASKLDVYEGAITNAYEREYLSAGVVFTDAELRDRFSLTPEQIGQYREFRAAVNESLDEMAAAEVVRLVPDLPAEVAAMAETAEGRKGLREAVEAFLGDENNDLWNQVQDKFNQAEKLKDRGYAPLSRFGKFYVHVVDDTGATQFFGLAETRYKANALAREMRGAFPDATVDQGVMSEQQYKLMSAVPLDSMELFASAIGAEQSEVFQKYIQLAKNNRSTMKRLIRRKGTAGFSDDVPRVLANFVTSNARAASAALHVKTAKEMAQEIQAGDVKDEAVKLIEAVTEPEESGSAIRGLMFTNFIGGSIASAVVNVTQPFMMTFPYLSQWGGASKAAGRLVEGARMAVTRAGGDAELRAALKRAEDDGIVSPQEIHHLIERAVGGLADKNPVIQKLAFVWGAPFSLAEQFNRRASFIAAYRTAKEEGIADPFQFAEKAVIETQGLYNAGNKPNAARGVAGATAMTFKQYSIHYLEWLSRMARSGKPGQKAALLALAMLFLAAGADGLPFMDDMDDVIDTVGQAMGYDTNTKRWRHQAAAAILGDELGEVATRGFSAMGGFPIDVSMRMGMGNLLPATDLLMKSNTDTARSLSELAGPGGALFIQYRDAAKAVLSGDVAGAAQKAVPVAMQNVAKAGTMFATGEYRDQRGRKVTDADLLDAGVKALGFQPSQIARESGMLADLRQSESLARMTEGEITDKWARAIVDGDREAEKEALAMRDDWNEKNPDMPIVVKRSQAIRKARQIRMERKDRFLKTVAPERRKAAQQDLEA